MRSNTSIEIESIIDKMRSDENWVLLLLTHGTIQGTIYCLSKETMNKVIFGYKDIVNQIDRLTLSVDLFEYREAFRLMERNRIASSILWLIKRLDKIEFNDSELDILDKHPTMKDLIYLGFNIKKTYDRYIIKTDADKVSIRQLGTVQYIFKD